jgi:hypothetical protein
LVELNTLKVEDLAEGVQHSEGPGVVGAEVLAQYMLIDSLHLEQIGRDHIGVVTVDLALSDVLVYGTLGIFVEG